MKKNTVSNRRVYFLITAMGIWGAAIGARLYFLQVVQSADLKLKAARQQQRTLEVSPARGVIYDRNNNELAVSIKVDSIFVNPDEIKEQGRTVATLSSITGVAKAELTAKLDTEKSFVWIKRKVAATEANAVRKAKLAGVYLSQEDHRFYPKRELASHVLGYVNMDEDGISGLEYKYNDSVKGQSGRIQLRRDARGQPFQSNEQPATPGANLITTIDQNIQFILEKEVRVAAEATRAQGIAAIVMDPRSGEILAMASYPDFNPNEFAKFGQGALLNRAVNSVYEPGSTFKILTVGSAVEEKLARPDELIDCLGGGITIAGHRISDHAKYGLLSVTEIVQHSSNVGAIRVGQRLGEDRFYSYVQRLGFGRPTGIDLPGEERGLTKPVARWSGMSLASMSMGQEIGVTPLQILSMVSAIANGGILYRPFIVKRIEDPNNGITEIDPRGERVLSAETTAQLRPMMEDVVTGGTARSGQLEGYTAAGKTGTAQKVVDGRYSKTKFWASFAGFAPATNPSLAMIVVVDEAVGLHQGGQVAAPVFKRVAEQALRYMSVPSDLPAYSPKYTLKENKKKSEPVRQVAPPALPVPAQGDWRVVDAAFSTPASAPPVLEMGDIAIPDFYGKSLRQVTEMCLRLGIRLRSTGSGAAIQQFPAPGSGVRAGAHVQVRFATTKQ